MKVYVVMDINRYILGIFSSIELAETAYKAFKKDCDMAMYPQINTYELDSP